MEIAPALRPIQRKDETRNAMPPVLLILSPARWDFVVQRTHHLLSRLAGRWHVVFVEEPKHARQAAWLDEQPIADHLSVLVPHLPPAGPGDAHDTLPRMLRGYLRQRGLQVDVAWVSTPAALPLLDALHASCVVYDCAAQSTAPRLRRQHAAMLERATLVLANGPSLYEALRPRHARVVCLPSAVDAAHFAPDARRTQGALAAQARQLQAPLPAPRLGYFGVIDARLDLELLRLLAQAHTDWSLVMVGPVVGLDAAQLPRGPNIHWLGAQPYALLPHLLASWDVALLPFLTNEATRLICPAQVPEYMAGGKPVLSTPLHDVAWMYSDSVAIAARGQPFVAACEALLAESAAQRAQRALQMLAAVSASSWERSAQALHQLLQAALGAKHRSAPRGEAAALRASAAGSVALR